MKHYLLISMKKKLNDPNTEALQLDQSRNDNGPTARAVTNENIKILSSIRTKTMSDT